MPRQGLAKVIEPTSNRVRLVEARCLLRKGERDAGLSLLEDVRENAKGSGDEEEAWYNTTRLLGQLYLEELNRPDLALKAYNQLVYDAHWHGSYQSYRSYRFQWSGGPPHGPALAVEASGSGLNAYVSWNGDTRTAPTSSGFSRVHSRKRKS